MDNQAWINTPSFWTDQPGISANLPPYQYVGDDLSRDVVPDESSLSQLDYDYNRARILTNIAPSSEPFLPHPGPYNPPQDFYQTNMTYDAPFESRARDPIHSGGRSGTRLQSHPYARHTSTQSSISSRPTPTPIPSRLPLSHPSSFAPQTLPQTQPYQPHQEIPIPPQPDTRSPSNRPIKHFVYKCAWIAVDGQACVMHFTSDQNSILRHLEERHQVRRSGTTLCRWGGACRRDAMRHDTIARHIQTHLDIKWACSLCEHTATRRGNVKKHVDQENTKCSGVRVDEICGPGVLVIDMSPFAKGQEENVFPGLHPNRVH
ncbi:hypothetical protein BJ138DRAFT_440647 [Hygrophoropsis aurantiaca]|uniref:Uncharacterized protein n=1 Tax=Hygrophoropsis aurantiaca TaxID=72124 RepID=A0ACB8A400_9AGAM|nr:hypothetical protein BJ138DRAFT_440647 [Hygrophoropsis aurantiaca]